nr:lamin tail domain-containing protein [uncultured Arsenicibacter sp.]
MDRLIRIFTRGWLWVMVFLLAGGGIRAQVTPGNLIVVQAGSASSNNTTATFLEVSPTLSGQTTAVRTYTVAGTGVNAIRISGSATSTGYLSHTNDGSLVTFTGVSTTNTASNANTLNPRSVVTLDATGAVAVATSYSGNSGQQTRSATSLNNSNWFIADQNGLYTNNATSASPTGNIRTIKAFGGTVYVSQASSTTTTIQVNTVSAPSGGTISGLPGLTNNADFQDYYLIQSGSNGNTYDILYTISATSNTAGTIAKYSFVNGSWTANGTYTTTFGGFGLVAQRVGNTARLYVTSGQGALSANSIIQLTDATGYNLPLSITTGNNLILFTTATGTTLKGIDFAPIIPAPVLVNNAAALTACVGSPLTLSATCSSGSVVWSNNTTAATLLIAAVAAGNTAYSASCVSGGASSVATPVTVTGFDNPVATLSASSTLLTCAQRSVTLTAGGGTSYSFSTGDTGSSTIVVSGAGVYSAIVGNTNGCTALATTTVTSGTDAASISIIPASSTISCANPVISLTAVGDGALLWSTGESTTVISVTSGGPYSVTITGGNGCTNVASTDIISDTALIGVILPPTSATLTCLNPSLTLTASGGNSYTYTNGTTLSTSNTLTVSQAGTYTVIVAGANGCRVSGITTIVSDTAVQTVTIIPNAATICLGQSATLVADVTGGQPGYSYSWTGLNGSVSGAATATVVISDLLSGGVNRYNVTVTDGRGCPVSQTVTVTVTAPATPDFGGSRTVSQNSSLVLSNTATCAGSLVWGQTAGGSATGTGTITVPTGQTGVLSYTAVCQEGSCVSPVRSVSVTVTTPVPTTGLVRITEYMYSGTNLSSVDGEFVELTNTGSTPVDMTGWSFDDDSRLSGTVSLSAFGVVQPGESVIICSATATTFRTAWNLGASVKIVGGNTEGLGRNDEINIYDATGALADRLTYGDENFAGSFRTQNTSAWTTPDNLGTNRIQAWQQSVVGDAQTSFTNTAGNKGNPGRYVFIPALTVLPVSLTAGNTPQGTPSAAQSYSLTSFSLSAAISVTASTGVEISTAVAGPYSTSVSLPASTTAQLLYARLTWAAVGAVSATITHASGSLSANVRVTGAVLASAPPSISVDAAATSAYLSLPPTGPAYISGVINDPTDPASTSGVSFTLTDADTPAGSLTVSVTSSNQSVVSTGGLSLTGSAGSRRLTITPAGSGTSTITVAVTDGQNTVSYVINYAASAASTATSRFHTDRSDASTAQDAGGGYMLVGDDESNVLRLYSRTQSGLPVRTFDVTASLSLTQLSGGVPREVDIEASVRSGNRIFWFGSQSNNDDGTSRTNRNRIFATDLTGTGASTSLTYGGRYDYLRDDLIAWDVNNLHGKGANYYGLAASAAPGVGSKQASGYNIEGAEFAPDGNTVYIGFRAPQVPANNRSKALIVPVTNLTALIANNGGTPGSATFSSPIELDLGGRGIREIKKNAGNEYLIVAGAAGDFGAAPNDFRLYTWTGVPTDAAVLRTADLSALGGTGSSIESIVELPAPLTPSSSIQFLMDTGDLDYYGNGAAKDLTQNNWKKFRSDYAVLGNAILPVSATLAGTATVCSGQSATLTVSVTNGTTPYSLTISNGSTTSAITGYTSGQPVVVSPATSTTYTIIALTDAASVTGAVSGTAIVTVRPPVSVSLTPVSQTITCAQPAVVVAASVSGGSGSGYSFTLSPAGTVNTTGSFTVNTANTYTVRVTDGGGCTAVSASVSVISGADVPTISSFVANNTLTCAQTSVTLTASATGGVAPLTYAIAGPDLSNPVAASVASVSVAGTYTVTVTGGNGCSTTATVTVGVNTGNQVITVTTSGMLGNGIASVSVIAQLSGAGSYTIAGPNGFSSIAANGVFPVTQTGPYSVSAINAVGCLATGSVLVQENAAPPLVPGTFVPTNMLTCPQPGQTATAGLGAVATGTGFAFTGPNGYVFSNVYRQPGTYNIFADGITQPGTYTLTITNQGVVVGVYTAGITSDCTSGRVSQPVLKAAINGPELKVTLGGNPTADEYVVVTVEGAAGQSLAFRAETATGTVLDEKQVAAAGSMEQQRLRFGTQKGSVYLKITTPSGQKTIWIAR